MDIKDIPPLPPGADIHHLYNTWAPIIAKLQTDNRRMANQIAMMQAAIMGRRP